MKIEAVRDWVEWHEGYDDPASSLSRRLCVVRRRLGEVLDALPPGGRRLVSLCAGDGRDVIPVLAPHPRRRNVDAVLVELVPQLANAASVASQHAGLERVDVRRVDAGDPSGYRDALPADVLLLCGIFGNIVEEDIKRTIAAASAMVVPGGFVLWTRGGSEPDLRSVIRGWFIEAGMAEVAFDGHPEVYGVGLCRVERPSSGGLPDRLFTFVK